MSDFSFKTAIVAGIMLAFTYSTGAAAVTLYKWVDAEGNVSYQDQPPSDGQKYEEKSFSSEGTRTGDTNAEVARSRAKQESPVMLYIAENCASCDLVSEILESSNVPYDKTPVDTDPKAQKKLIELIGSMRVPILTIGEVTIEGSNRTTIEDALRRNGYPITQAQVTKAAPQ